MAYINRKFKIRILIYFFSLSSSLSARIGMPSRRGRIPRHVVSHFVPTRRRFTRTTKAQRAEKRARTAFAPHPRFTGFSTHPVYSRVRAEGADIVQNTTNYYTRLDRRLSFPPPVRPVPRRPVATYLGPRA